MFTVTMPKTEATTIDIAPPTRIARGHAFYAGLASRRRNLDRNKKAYNRKTRTAKGDA